MTMRYQLSVLFAVLIGLLAACGGGGTGGGNVAGIGGTGITSSGTITGFGSIFVNGIEYETNGSTIVIDDNPGPESDLRVGMVVKVTGTRDANGTTGTATRVEFDHELEGPISGVVTTNADGTAKTFSVIGIQVRVTATGTSFGDNLTFASVNSGDLVEVSGFVDANGVLNATYIEKRAGGFQAGVSEVEAKGRVSGLNASTFELLLTSGHSITVNHAAADKSDLPGSALVNGQFVEVKGTLANGNSTTVDATRIELEGFDDNEDNASLEGIITDFVSSSNFRIGGQPVNAGSATRSPATLVLGNGVKVEAEGAIIGGVLIASEIEARGGAVKIHAPVTSVNAGANQVTLGLGNGSITVNVTSTTRMEDSISGLSPFRVSHINNGDFLEIEAFTDTGNNVIATRLKRDSIDNTLLQGIVSASIHFGGGVGSITILGVSFQTTAATDFEDANDNQISPKENFYILNGGPNGKLVKVADDIPTDGVANEVEYEN